MNVDRKNKLEKNSHKRKIMLAPISAISALRFYSSSCLLEHLRRLIQAELRRGLVVAGGGGSFAILPA